MIRGYRKYRKQMPTEAPQQFAQLPRVTVQLPIYNEQYVVERLLEESSKIDYPRELLQIQVLDDSTDDTHPFTERLVDEYRDAGLPIEYIHRTNRHGYKAGALAKRTEDRHRRDRGHLRRRFHPARSTSCAAPCTSSPIRKSAWCRPAGVT